MPAPTANIAPVTITFNNTSQGDNLQYLWNFGDGQTSQQANPTHTFQAGVFEVTLTVSNDNGSDTTSAVIVATAPSQGQGPGGEDLPPGFNASSGPPPGFNGNQNTGNQNTGNQNNNQQNNFNEQNPGFNAGSGPPNLDF